MTPKQLKRLMITIATNEDKIRNEVRKNLKILSALRGENQDIVLLEALIEYRKKIENKEKGE